MKIHELYNEWLPDKKRQVKPSTLSTYVVTFEKNILPYFGDMEYDDLKMKDVQRFVDEKLSAGYSHKSIKDMVVCIKMLLNYAVDELEMKPVPGKRIMRFPEETIKKDFEAYTDSEQKKLMSYFISNPSFEHLGMMITLCSGVRIGEITALQFKDIDLDSRTMKIEKTLERIYSIDSDGHRKGTQLIIQTPKSLSSRREIPLPKEIINILKKSSALVIGDYFVCSGKAKPIEPRVYRLHFNQACKNAGVRVMKYHGLRHSFATRMLEKKVDIKTTSIILGHSDVKITMNTYMHPTEEMKKNAINITSSLF